VLAERNAPILVEGVLRLTLNTPYLV